MTIVAIGGEELKVQRLAECEFTSTRKRASVIYRVGDEIVLFTKGADSIVKELLTEESLQSSVTEVAQTKVDEYSEIGLRTLFLAYKVLDEDEYNAWKEE